MSVLSLKTITHPSAAPFRHLETGPFACACACTCPSATNRLFIPTPRLRGEGYESTRMAASPLGKARLSEGAVGSGGGGLTSHLP